MPMISTLCHTMYFKWLGWDSRVTVPHRDKCVICIAPHTSNWDFLIAELYYAALGRRAAFLMKREWFFWPIKALWKWMGGIPVNREKNNRLTDRLAEQATQAPHFNLAVTPEGTRSRNPKWKLGFYFIALKAGLPIQLYAIDYKEKCICCTRELFPTGDIGHDMAEITAYYSHFTGKHPERFALCDREQWQKGY